MDVILKYFTDFTAQQLEQLTALKELYSEWNEKINVISRKDIQGLYEKHVLHSLSIAAVAEFNSGMEVIDIGTGGGFPGIPLAILFPEVRFLLVDSIAKKLKVVQAVADSIQLKNVTVRHTRAEEIKDRKFDLAISRAVAPLKELWQWSRPLLRNSKSLWKNDKSDVTGLAIHEPGLICLKGGDLTTEIQESGTKPRVFEIEQLFRELYFKEKYVLFVALNP